MKYQIYFNQGYNGVYSHHESIEAAKQHIKMLSSMTSGIFTWTLYQDKKIIEVFPQLKTKPFQRQYN